MESAITDWASLPPELLQLIAKNLTVVFDYIRFRSVCASWRLAAAIVDLEPQLPWLVVSSAANTVSFLNHSDLLHRYTFHIPEARGKKIYGFAHGWLLMVSNPSLRTGRTVSLLNPITRDHVQLLQLPKVFDEPDITERAVLCSHPTSSQPRQMLVAFLTLWRKSQSQLRLRGIALFRQGDNGWICNYLPAVMDDIVYFNNELHCVTAYGQLAVLQIDKLTWLANPHVDLTWLIRGRWNAHSLCSRLVEADGDLLLLTWYSEVTLRISILDRSQSKDFKWVEIGVMDMMPFSMVHTVCARGLPDCKGYRIDVAFESLDGTASSCIKQEIDVIPGVGMTKQLCLRVPEGSWLPRQGTGRRCLTWIVPNLN